MRRKDKELTDDTLIKTILEKSAVCRLGMADGDKPYVVPMNFGYRESALYFHGALKGRKIDMLKKNPNVCVEFDLVTETLEADQACDWSMKFQSVIAFGSASLLSDAEEKRDALGIIMAHYSDKAFEFPENKINATAVIKVDIERMTCKQSGF
jgi:nitroimidazol reductase NimA-like FMN-containing flavoprotein (pyridoxamine 5'-phosphate oxidase superfamily)